MKRSLALLIATAVLVLLPACDTLMVSQYRVASVATAKEDKKKLLESLARVASRIGLEDVTSTSVAKDTLVFYSQPKVAHFQVQLGARVVGDSIVVDLSGGFGPKTSDFAKAQKELLAEMNLSFAGRYEIPSPRVPIKPPNQSLEPTTLLGTSAAEQPLVPSRVVAHL